MVTILKDSATWAGSGLKQIGSHASSIPETVIAPGLQQMSSISGRVTSRLMPEQTGGSDSELSERLSMLRKTIFSIHMVASIMWSERSVVTCDVPWHVGCAEER